MINAIEVRGLCKDYRDFQLRDVDLTLPGGSILGLIGENGAGKSTTIKAILGLIRRNGGSIRIFGREILGDDPSYKEDIGVVLDEVGIPACLSAVQVGKVMARTFTRWDKELYAQYLKKLNLPEKRPFKEYSKGMKMKLGIAVALSHHPKLLILDEATSGLDPVVRDEVVEMFSEFTRDEDHAVLISSHIVSDLEKICDYIAFLHQGKLMLCEEKDRLLEEYGLIHCSREQLSELDQAAVKGVKTSPYGVEALVRRDGVPAGMQVSPVSIEELFIFMVKEAA